MNRIRVIAVVLSMVLFLLGASGNTNEETRKTADSYESEKTEDTEKTLAGAAVMASAGYMENIRHLTETDVVLGPADTGLAQARRSEALEAWKLSRNENQDGNQQEGSKEEENQKESGWVIDISQEDYTALLKLVEAETSGEDIKGRMLVANVVLNRLETGRFGSSVKEVIYQRVDGRAQFSPVGTGRIERVVVTPETVEAVERALCGEDESQGALYFAARAHANPKNMAWFDRNLTRLFAYHGHEFFM